MDNMFTVAILAQGTTSEHDKLCSSFYGIESDGCPFESFLWISELQSHSLRNLRESKSPPPTTRKVRNPFIR